MAQGASNFWGFKASRKPNQNFIPGTSKWVSNEMNEANKLILQNSQYFSGLVSSELVWLNELMVEIIESKEDGHADALLLLKSPAKLASKNSPIKKIRQETLMGMASQSTAKELPAKVLDKPPQASFKPKIIDERLEEREKIIKQVQKIIPNNRSLNNQEIPKLIPLKDEAMKPDDKAHPIPALLNVAKEKTAPASDVSLMLRSAEKLGPVDIPEVEKPEIRESESDDFDASFQAITRTIKVSKESNDHPGVVVNDYSSSAEIKPPVLHSSETQKSEASKLPSTTPIAERIPLSSFASLPSREPLTVKSTKKERISSKFGSISPTHHQQEKASKKAFPSIYPHLSKLKPLPKSMLQDDKDEDSPFKVSTKSSAKDWVPPSPNKVKKIASYQKLEDSPIKSGSNNSPLNSIFANAIKRARDLISPSKEQDQGTASADPKPETKSVKRVASSKSQRGNLMDRLTADTESSAARHIKKLDLHQSKKLYPDIESPLSKRHNESPLAKKYKADNQSYKSIPTTVQQPIPKLPVFKPKSLSPLKQKSPVASAKRKMDPYSPEKIITKQELSRVNGSTIAATTAELQKKRMKAQASLTSLSLNKDQAPKRKSNIPQHRINKRMAEERHKVEELRKQRLSNAAKVISIDQQLKNPLHKMREKSMKANEPVYSEPLDSRSKTMKTGTDLDLKPESHPVLLPLSDEAMNKRRKTEEKGLDAKANRVTMLKTTTPTAATSTTSTSARTQTLMRTAMIQHARLNKSSVVSNLKEPAKSTQSTPTNRKAMPITQNSISPMVLPEIFSEPEDDDEGHVLKDWAESPELRRLLFKQQNINPDMVFGAIAPLNMNEIFKASRAAKFRARSSSAHWIAQDMLSHKEADEYTKKMGWKK